jgi:hypothetical protein
MGIPNADQIVTTRHIRDFIQFHGPSPHNKPQFYGQDAQYMLVSSLAIPEVGTIAPVWAPDPQSPAGYYYLVNKTIAAPGTLPKATITLLERHGAVPRHLGRVGEFNLYEVVGNAADLSDFARGWTDYVMIYANGMVETKTPGARGNWNTDKEALDQLAATFSAIYGIGPLGLGEVVLPTYEVLDVTYGSFRRRGDIGPYDDGTQAIYACTKHGGGAGGFVKYSLDGGGTWTTLTVTGIGATEDLTCIRIMGEYLVVMGNIAVGHYYIEINPLTGAPVGSTWTKVTGGYVAAKYPKSMWISNPREAFICAVGGYIYKMTDPTAAVTVANAGVATTEDLNRIDGQNGLIVAVGDAATVVVSSNYGLSWAPTATDPGADDVKGVAIVNPATYWVCDGAGDVYWTDDSGAVWHALAALPNLDCANDIVFATPEVGYVVGDNGSALGLIFATWNGGETWVQALRGPRLMNALTVQGVNSIAVPRVSASDPEVAADNVALACLSSGYLATTGSVVLGRTAHL